MATKYFKYPFATSGDKTAIPNLTQPSGTISYQVGYGGDYQLPIGSDPDALAIDRLTFNELMYDITQMIQFLQQNGVPNFITSADNEGSPYAYGKFAYVLYDAGSGLELYQSLAAANATLPTDNTKWAKINSIAQTIQQSNFVYAADSGAANAYVVNTVPAYATLTAGNQISMTTTHTNTGASTLNAGTAGVKPIKIATPIGLVDVPANAIVSGVIYRLQYDGTNWQLQNPSVTPAIAAKVYLSNTLVFAANAVGQKIIYDSVSFDPFNLWDNSNHEFTIPISGKYLVTAHTQTGNPGGATGDRFFAVYRNGTIEALMGELNYVAADENQIGASALLNLTAGDIIYLAGSQPSNPTPTTIVPGVSNIGTYFSLTMQGS